MFLHSGWYSASFQDKTFGLKNKKGAKQQKYIKNVTQQVKYGQQSARQAAQADAEKGGKKNDKKKELDELNELFKPVVAAQKVSKGNPMEMNRFSIFFSHWPLCKCVCQTFLTSVLCAGVDPKSVLCAFYKQGQCTKGDKCKFSHDLSMERKCEKRSVYVDERDEDLEKGQSRGCLLWQYFDVPRPGKGPDSLWMTVIN